MIEIANIGSTGQAKYDLPDPPSLHNHRLTVDMDYL
jgi:hypothetical protein